MSESFQTKYRILNEFQESKQLPGFPLGTDRSFDYTRDKGVMLYIADDNLESTISFKSFLKSFTLSTTTSLNKAKRDIGFDISVTNVGIKYSIDLQIPAISIDDAIVNAARLEELSIFVGSIILNTEAGTIGESESVKRVLLSNLIHNGKYKQKQQISSFSMVRKFGAKCTFSSMSYTVDTEMGFFEHKGRLWPKSYDLKLEILMNSSINNNQVSVGGFNPDQSSNNYYATGDIKTWPFGVD